eukprot:753749-Hanusia_phi.AAC.1
MSAVNGELKRDLSSYARFAPEVTNQSPCFNLLSPCLPLASLLRSLWVPVASNLFLPDIISTRSRMHSGMVLLERRPSRTWHIPFRVDTTSTRGRIRWGRRGAEGQQSRA